MCLSALGQIIFGGVMLVALGLTIVSMFTPGWNEFKNQTKTDMDNIDINTGLFKFHCKLPTDDGSNPATTTEKPCDKWWDDLETWNKVVVVAMILALILEIAALAWNLVTFCACCCKKYIIHPLTGFAIAIAIVLAIAIIVFAANHEDQLKNLDLGQFNEIKKKGEVGYSFYMACGALAAAIIDIFVGGLTVCLAKHCL